MCTVFPVPNHSNSPEYEEEREGLDLLSQTEAHTYGGRGHNSSEMVLQADFRDQSLVTHISKKIIFITFHVVKLNS